MPFPKFEIITVSRWQRMGAVLFGKKYTHEENGVKLWFSYWRGVYYLLHSRHPTTTAVDPASPRAKQQGNCGDRDCWQCNPPETPGN